MDPDQVIARLRAHEAELRAAGIDSLAIFGSVARGEATEASDVDVVVRLSGEAQHDGFAYFGRLAALIERLRDILGCPVDVVTELIRKERLRQRVAKEAILTFWRVVIPDPDEKNLFAHHPHPGPPPSRGREIAAAPSRALPLDGGGLGGGEPYEFRSERSGISYR
jgi:predicted nucleotidyltransferase